MQIFYFDITSTNYKKEIYQEWSTIFTPSKY